MKLSCLTLNSNPKFHCNHLYVFYALFFIFSSLLSGQAGFAQGPANTPRNSPAEVLRGEETFNEDDFVEEEAEPTLLDDNDEFRTDGFLSLGLSRVMSHPDDSAYESNKSGYLLAPQISGAISSKNWTADLGLGFFFSRVSGRAAHVISPFGADKTNVSTRAVVVSATVGYLFKSYLFIAPKVLLPFGADSSFSPWGEGRKSNLFTGGQLMFVQKATDSTWRFGVELLSDSSISRRQVSWFGVVAQYGVPISLQK